MKLEPIDGVIINPLTQYTDDRGWLTEAYRSDQTHWLPQMAYVSATYPGVVRGPHEHLTQTDMFVFITGHWWVKLWDHRQDSLTYCARMRFKVTTPTMVIVPPGVVHAYGNAGGFRQALVINLPDQLYKGVGKLDPVDEIRHEGSPLFPVKDIRNQHWFTRFCVACQLFCDVPNESFVGDH